MSSCLPSSIKLPTIETASITLAVADWSNNSQTATVLGVTASNAVIAVPAPASTADYVDAGCLCVEQGEDTLTFTCTDVPSADLTVNVLVLS